MKKIAICLILLLFVAGCDSRKAPDLKSERGSVILDTTELNEPTQDYWVYIRTYNRPEMKVGEAGRSKKGDIVDIRPADGTNIPSLTAKDEWAITKVGLTKAEKQELKQSWEEQIGVDEFNEPLYETKAYRKYKVDIDNLKLKKGLNGIVNPNTLKLNTSEKTEADIQAYNWQARFYVMARPFRKLNRKSVPFAYGAETVSTINKTGEDYDTLTLWEDAKDGDLVTETRQETAECYDDDGDLDDAVTIDGSTTNAAYYMKITVPVGERHNGTAGTGFCLNSSANNNTININDFYCVVEWLEIKDWTGYAGWDTRYAIISLLVSAKSTVKNNIIHDSGNDTRNVQHGMYFIRENYVYNNIVYNISGYGIHFNNYGSNIDVFNNTVYNYNTKNNSYQGIEFGNDDLGDCKNNLVIAGTNGGNCFAFGGITHDYNASSDATATGANSLDSGDGTPPSTSDFVSVTGGSENLHLVSTAVEIDEGVDLGSIANIDINGRDRDAEGDTWDIGADEYVSGAPSQPVGYGVIMVH